jgi:hypothetical protein
VSLIVISRSSDGARAATRVTSVSSSYSSVLIQAGLPIQANLPSHQTPKNETSPAV